MCFPYTLLVFFNIETVTIYNFRYVRMTFEILCNTHDQFPKFCFLVFDILLRISYNKNVTDMKRCNFLSTVPALVQQFRTRKAILSLLRTIPYIFNIRKVLFLSLKILNKCQCCLSIIKKLYRQLFYWYKKTFRGRRNVTI